MTKKNKKNTRQKEMGVSVGREQSVCSIDREGWNKWKERTNKRMDQLFVRAAGGLVVTTYQRNTCGSIKIKKICCAE